MIEANLVATPLATSPILTLHYGTTLSDLSEFRNIVSSLQYLSLTSIGYMVNNCLSLCINLPVITGMPLNTYCAISVELLIMVSCFITTPPWLFMLSPILIRQVTKMISHLLVHILYTLVTIQFLGVPRSNVQLHAPLLKLNIV